MHGKRPPESASPVAPEEVVVRRSGRVHRLKYHPGATLLETMRLGGVRAPHLCEQGVCGTCMVRLLKGEVALRENHVLGDHELAAGFTLACQGVPVSEVCEIEVDG